MMSGQPPTPRPKLAPEPAGAAGQSLISGSLGISACFFFLADSSASFRFGGGGT